MKLIADLKKLEAETTPGPWYADIGNSQIESANDGDCFRDGVCTFAHNDRDGINGRINPVDRTIDAEFIVAACNATPKLIAAIEKLYDGLQNETCPIWCSSDSSREQCPGCNTLAEVRKILQDGDDA